MCALIPGRHFHFERNGMFPTLWHNLTKEISWKIISGLLFSHDLSAFLHMSQCWWRLPIPNHPSDFGVLTFVTAAAIGSCLRPFPLWHCDKWACMFMCVDTCTHTPNPQQVSYTGSITVDLLRRRIRDTSPDLCQYSHTAQKRNIFG